MLTKNTNLRDSDMTGRVRLAYRQLHSYIDAINFNPRNSRLRIARAGSDLFKDLNGRYIEMPLSGRVLQMTTYNHPLTKGMVYYKIFNCNDLPDGVTVLSVDIPDDAKKRYSSMLKDAELYPELYYQEVMYADNVTDIEYYDAAVEFGKAVTQETKVINGIQYTILESPTHGTYWRVDGLPFGGKLIDTRNLSAAEKYLIYMDYSFEPNTWFRSQCTALLAMLALSAPMTTIPTGSPGFVPAIP